MNDENEQSKKTIEVAYHCDPAALEEHVRHDEFVVDENIQLPRPLHVGFGEQRVDEKKCIFPDVTPFPIINSYFESEVKSTNVGAALNPTSMPSNGFAASICRVKAGLVKVPVKR